MARRRQRRKAPPLNAIFAADTQVFRFYPDGTVLDVLVRPAPQPSSAETLAGWLRRDNVIPGVHVARYVLEGEQVTFTTRGRYRDEEITVRGTWVRGVLTLGQVGRGWEIPPRRFQRFDQRLGRVCDQ
ncbi:hypothetical protein AB0K02_19030 [Streptomyces sp. NPDC049597]|uniref:hypothetical protein n=1 Tax=Streptomyces sp. NPDC049597 TaxID=3155276 RepID=UPI003433B886